MPNVSMTERRSDRPLLVLATHNLDKVQELRRLFVSLQAGESEGQAAERPTDAGSWQIVAATELGAAPQVSEDAPTLAGNARQKAVTIARWSGFPSLADDTGLEVDALGGRPGVWAHRYAGPTATYADNRRLLLHELAGVPAERRTARFRTVVAIAVPRRWWQRTPHPFAPEKAAGADLGTATGPEQGQSKDETPGDADDLEIFEVEGVLPGRITLTERGSAGFGYDPVFEVPEWGRTLAELGLDRKNQLSHRARAVRAAWPILQQLARRWCGRP